MSDTDIQVSFSADASGMVSATNNATASVSRFADRIKAAQNPSAGLTEAIKALTAATQANTTATAANSQALTTEAQASANAEAATARNAASITRTAHAHGVNSLAMRESLVLIREMMRGDFTRMAGSASLLASATVGLPAILNPVTLSIAAIAVAIGGVAIAMQQGRNDQVRFENALQGTGQFAGITEDKLNSLASTLGTSTKVGAVEARAALLQVAQSGKFAGDNIGLAANDVILMAKALGGDTSSNFAKISGLMGDTVNVAYKLQQQTHSLTAEQFAHVIQLVKQADATGDFSKRQEAVRIVLQSVSGELKNQAENLGIVEKLVRGVTKGFGDMIEAIRQFGRDPSTSVQVKSHEALLARLKQVHDQQGKIPANVQLEINKQQELVKVLQAKLDAENKANAAASGQAQGDSGKIDKLTEEYNKSAKTAGAASELDILRNNLQKKLETEKNYFADSTAEELTYWNNALATAKLKGTERAQINTIIFNLMKTQAKQGYSDQVSIIKAGEASKVEAAKTAITLAKLGFDDEKEAVRELVASNVLTKAQGAAKVVEIAKREMAAELTAIDAEHKARVAALAAQLALEQKLGIDTTKTWQAIATYEAAYNNQRLVAERTLTNQLKKLRNEQADDARATSDKVEKWYEKSFKGIENSFASTTSQLILRQTSWAAVGKKVTEQLLSTFIEAEARKVGAMLIAAATGKAIRQTDGQKEVAQDAALAAAGAYKATAAIPIIGPALAPAAGAVAFGAVEAFGSLASAAGGFDIPTGVNPLTQLHQEEMVLPASLANPIRSMASGANGGGGSSGSSNVTFNYQPNHTHQSSDLKGLLSAQGAEMRRWINNEVRNGSLKMA